MSSPHYHRPAPWFPLDPLLVMIGEKNMAYEVKSGEQRCCPFCNISAGTAQQYCSCGVQTISLKDKQDLQKAYSRTSGELNKQNRTKTERDLHHIRFLVSQGVKLNVSKEANRSAVVAQFIAATA